MSLRSWSMGCGTPWDFQWIIVIAVLDSGNADSLISQVRSLSCPVPTRRLIRSESTGIQGIGTRIRTRINSRLSLTRSFIRSLWHPDQKPEHPPRRCQRRHKTTANAGTVEGCFPSTPCIEHGAPGKPAARGRSCRVIITIIIFLTLDVECSY